MLYVSSTDPPHDSVIPIHNSVIHRSPSPPLTGVYIYKINIFHMKTYSYLAWPLGISDTTSTLGRGLGGADVVFYPNEKDFIITIWRRGRGIAEQGEAGAATRGSYHGGVIKPTIMPPSRNNSPYNVTVQKIPPCNAPS